MGFFRKDSWGLYGIRTEYFFENIIIWSGSNDTSGRYSSPDILPDILFFFSF